MKKSHLLGVSCIIPCLLFAPLSVFASTILQAVSVTSNTLEDRTDMPLVNLINQSGLSTNYISGVTDFDVFTSTTTVERDGIGSAGSAPPVNFDFDMGSLVLIDAIALWTQGLGSASLVNFNLIVSEFSDFSVATDLGAFTMINSNPRALANIFTFDATQAQFIRLSVTSNFGWPIATRFNEFAARSAVPIPLALWLFGSGLLGLIVLHRRKIAD